MAPNLQARFREAAQDPDLLSLERDVALLDARLMSLLEKAGTSGPDWVKLKEARESLLVGRRTDNPVMQRDAINALVDLIAQGTSEWERWQQIDELIDSRRKLIEALHKHQVQNAQIVTLTQMQLLFTGLAQLIKQAFIRLMSQLHQDREKAAAQTALTEIAKGFKTLTNVRAGVGVSAA